MAKRAEALEATARRYEALLDDDSQDESFVPVKAEVESNDSAFITRFSSEEIALLHRAATEHQTNITDFIRAAALAAAAGELDLPDAHKVAALRDIQARARELSEALQRL